MEKTKSNRMQRIAKDIAKNKVGYMMLAPLFLGILVFCYYPPVSGLVLAFFQKRSNTDAVFVGLGNFKELFADPFFLGSIGTMFKIMLPKLIIGIVVPLIMAELIFAVSSQKMQGVYRILVLVPIVAPGVVGLLIWRNIYGASSNGVLNGVLHALRVIDEGTNINWLGSYDWVIFSIIFMGFPWVGGTAVLIYMSGLMTISGEMLEASRLDGASTMRRIFSIDLPLLLGQIKYFLVFGLIGGFQDYGIQIILTKGGPGDATMVPGYYLFTKIQVDDQLGYASAIGAVMFVVIALSTLFAFKVVKTDRTEP